MMKKSEITNTGAKNQPNKTSEINSGLADQLLYLQQTIGNKDVADLIKKNAIHSASTLQNTDALVKNLRKKEDAEAVHISRDKALIEKEALDKIHREKSGDIEELASKCPGKDIFANVSAELVYVEIPGQENALFYHHTKLLDAKVSLEEANRTGQRREIYRGAIVPFVFSFQIELEAKPVAPIADKDTEEKNLEEETAESKKAFEKENTVLETEETEEPLADANT
jgi:hypothetical protein